MPAGGAIIAGAGIGAAGSLIGGAKAGKGAAAAGKAQAEVAQQGLQDAKEARTKAYQIASSAAIPSASELKLMDQTVGNSYQALSAQLNSISKATEMLNNLSPSIKAAGEQTYNMLNGQASALLKPIQDTRARQRSELQNQLASRLGPGFQTTAAGILAMNRFDEDTTNTMASAQFQAFNQTLNASTSLAGLGGNLASQISASGTQMSQNAFNQQNAQQQLGIQAANIFAGGSAQVLNANAKLSDTIGNQFAGQINQGQNLAAFAGQIGQGAMTYGMMNSLNGSPSGSQPAQSQPAALGSVLGSGYQPEGGYKLGDFNSTNKSIA